MIDRYATDIKLWNMCFWRPLALMCILVLSFGGLHCQVKDTLQMAHLHQRDCEKVVNLSLKLLKIRETPGVCEQIADCYFDLGKYAAAEGWYSRAVEMDPQDLECHRKFAEALRVRSKFREAMAQMQIYATAVGDEAGVASFMDRCQRGLMWRANEGRYIVQPLVVVNSQETEIVAYQRKAELYFYSRATLTNVGKIRNPRLTRDPFNLFAYDLSNPEPEKACRLVAKHCSPNEIGLGMVWDDPNDQYYVARFEAAGNRKGLSTIYRCRRDGVGNVKEDPLAFCQKEFNNNFHPAIDPTGRVLVFVSDADTGLGGRDLFYCTRQKGHNWTDPLNLGKEVNTGGDETYPCFSSEGRLFFASDSLHGFGMTDIFAVDLKISEKEVFDGKRMNTELQVDWSLPRNVGAKINSAYDDFAIVWNPGEHRNSGYFTSNRPDSAQIATHTHLIDSTHLRCNIYSFWFKPEIVGTVFSEDTVQALAEPRALYGNIPRISSPTVMLYEEAQPTPHILSSDDWGRYYGNPRWAGRAQLVVQKKGYVGEMVEFDMATIPQGEEIRFDFKLALDTVQYLKFILPKDAQVSNLDTLRVALIDKETGKVEGKLDGLPEEIVVSLRRNRDYILRLGYRFGLEEVVTLGADRKAVELVLMLDPRAPAFASNPNVRAESGPTHMVVPDEQVYLPDTKMALGPPLEVALNADVTEPTVSAAPLWTFFYGYSKISLYNLPQNALQELRRQMHADSALILDLQVFTASGGDLEFRKDSNQKREAEAIKDFSKWLDISRSRIVTRGHTPTVKTNVCAACETKAQYASGRLEVRLRH